MADNKAFVVELNDEKGYQRLIPGAPTTHGMKSGRVYLEPGAACGIHSTEDKEEQLVFLSGCGTAIIGEEEMEPSSAKKKWPSVWARCAISRRGPNTTS
ncbi:MAG: hypothetical protein ACYSOF_00290 [Planctomycetota bacterium]|jgi:hypothetical protein